MAFERFFARDLDVAQLRALERALEGLPVVERGGGLDWRHGRVHAQVGGLHCERIFGPLQRDACRCGKFVGEALRGIVCDRCHVEVGDPSLRATRWACVVTRCGVVHPVLHAAAERELGCPIDLDALEDLDELDALEARTTQGLRVHRIPISPPTRREFVVAAVDPSGWTRYPGPTDRALRELIARLARLDRFRAEPLVPARLLVDLHAAAARLLAAGLAHAQPTLWGALEPPRRIPLHPHPPSRASRPSWRRPTRHLVRSMQWWGHDRLILEGQPGLRVLTIASHEVHEIAAGPCRLLGCIDDVLVVLGEHEPHVPAEIPGLAAYDLREGCWLAELPAIPLALFEQDQPEDACLLDAATGRIAAIENDSDRPGYFAHTPDLAHLWISDDNHEFGRVHACETGELALDLGMLPAGEDVDVGGAVALVRAGERWRVLIEDGRVFEIDRAGPRLVWQMRRRANAAAFSHDGERLALARGGSIAIHDAAGELLDVLAVPRRADPHR